MSLLSWHNGEEEEKIILTFSHCERRGGRKGGRRALISSSCSDKQGAPLYILVTTKIYVKKSAKCPHLLTSKHQFFKEKTYICVKTPLSWKSVKNSHLQSVNASLRLSISRCLFNFLPPPPPPLLPPPPPSAVISSLLPPAPEKKEKREREREEKGDR